jgi:transposase
VQGRTEGDSVMGWAPGAKERAVTRRQVILEAMAGKITWGAAAEILQMSLRSVRRLKWGYKKWGFDALYDRRRRVPSPKRASVQEVERVLRLYREKYGGFNVRHFHDLAVRDHGVSFSYSFVKKALQEAGLVRKHRARGRHRKRREPKPCRGEMLHLDGSPHAWLALCPEEKQTLIASVDDATSEVLYAQLEPAESTETVMKALKELFETYGLPMSLYTDRASWAAWTPKAGEKVDKSKLTQVGRALKRLGIEHIVAYSPQARGRSERLNRTFQDRLVNELRAAGIRTREAANRYIRERFVPDYNTRFARQPADPDTAFVSLGVSTDLEQILCQEDYRTVGQDNTVVFDNVRLQIAKQPGRRTCAGLHVTVRRHLNGTHSVWRASQALGWFDSRGKALARVAAHRGATTELPGAESRIASRRGQKLRVSSPAQSRGAVGMNLPTYRKSAKSSLDLTAVAPS